MSILIGRDTRLVVQGITGREGEFHSRQMLEYGTRIVAGMTPGKGGRRRSTAGSRSSTRSPRPSAQTGANTSCIFVPASGAPDAILEAVGAGIGTIFCITEGIPALDMLPVVEVVRAAGARLIGPNCPGATSPGRAKVGIIPGSIHREGRVGVVSPVGHAHLRGRPGDDRRRASASRPASASAATRSSGRRSSTSSSCSPADPETDAIVLIGEIGGVGRGGGRGLGRRAPARTCPMAAFIAGRTAPEGKRMGHAGAIISGGRGTAAEKVTALEAAGIRVAGSPTELPALLREAGYRGLAPRPDRHLAARVPSTRCRGRHPGRQPGRARRPEARRVERGPGRSAGRLDQLDEDAVAAPRVEERDRSLGAGPGRGVDQLDAVDRQAGQRRRDVRDLEADVMEALAPRREEPRDARWSRRSAATSSILRLADRQERDAHTVGVGSAPPDPGARPSMSR